MNYSFAEVYSRIGKRARTDQTKMMVGLLVLEAIAPAAVETGRVMQVLRLHLGKASPGNPNRALRKATPFVEAVAGDGNLQWRLRRPGIARLEQLTGFQFGGEQDLVISIQHLHQEIRTAAEKLFREGNYPEAVGRAAKQLNAKVRGLTGRSRDDGIKMMHQAFAIAANGSARLLVGPVSNDWERDRQEGFQFVMAGVQQGILNVDKHGHLHISSPQVALEMLGMMSFLARTLDACTVVTPTAATG
jgi:uncharacterized protein (TIGR02391 family)